MNGHHSPPGARPGEGPDASRSPESLGPVRPFRLAALIVVIIGVLALAAAAFVLSYSGVRATALSAGVTPRLARVYPVIFDGVLVVACAAAISVQGARWWLRLYAWLSVLVIVGAVAAADSVHAMAVRVPKRPIEAAGAIVPWAVVLIGFTLLYAMARQAWPRRRVAQAPAGGPAVEMAGPLPSQPPATEPPGSQPPGPESSAPSDAPATERASAAEPAVTSPYHVPPSTARLNELLARRAEPVGAPAAADPQPVRHAPERDEPSDADAEAAPHFNRLRSTPTPPEEEPWIVEASDE